MLTLTLDQSNAIASDFVRLCTCVEILRRDNKVLRLTDHDAPLLVGGKWFYPGLVSYSAGQTQAGVRSGNRDVLGFVDSTLISDEDLKAGLYSSMPVWSMLVEWNLKEVLKRDAYWIESVSTTGSDWTFQLISLAGWLQQEKGLVLTRNCRHSFGKGGCQKDRDATAISTTVTSSTPKTITVAMTLTAGAHAYAECRFTSGVLNGQSFDVRANTTSVLNLWDALPKQPTSGDGLTIYLGCDGTLNTCKTVHNNVINFGGFPTVPGQDQAYMTPSSKA